MDYLAYVFLALAGLAVLILLVMAIKIAKLVKNLNRNLELLPALIMNLKSSSEKLNDNLDLSQKTLETLNHLLGELKIVPRVVEELGNSVKDFETFLKGQVEVVKDDLHFVLEDSRVILRDVKEISSEVKEKTFQVSHNLDPLLKSLSDTVEVSKLFLDNLNNTLKKTYVEISAITTGVTEVFKGIRRLIKI